MANAVKEGVELTMQMVTEISDMTKASFNTLFPDLGPFNIQPTFRETTVEGGPATLALFMISGKADYGAITLTVQGYEPGVIFELTCDKQYWAGMQSKFLEIAQRVLDVKITKTSQV